MADQDVLHDAEQALETEAEATIEPPVRVFVHNDDVTNAISFRLLLYRNSP